MVENQVTPAMPAESGWTESFKAKTSGLVEKVRDSKETIFNVLLYAGLGFLVGYLAKKFSAFIIMVAIGLVVLVALQQFEIIYIAINWTKVQTALGMTPVAAGENVSILAALWEWMKANVLISVSFIIGFLLGLKFGA